MLKIKRVPTVVSNYQKEDEEEDEDETTRSRGGGCGRNCLQSCCISGGAKLPLYAFRRMNKFEKDSSHPHSTFLDSLLLGKWESCMQKGLFRYDVSLCETKVIPGEHGFIAQLNEGRHLQKRPTEFRVDKVLQPFDANKFNFTKVGQEELMFQFEASEEEEDDESHFFPNAPIDVENSPSVVAINVSPIEYGHVLLIPRVLECLPQRIDRESLLLAVYMAAEAASPYYRLGYNSLGAFATINHLHFQAYYLEMSFPIEKASTKKIRRMNNNRCGVRISELVNYPVRGLVYQEGNSIEDLCNAVSDSCICLQENNIPYNVLIADSGKRIFILPQCYAEKQALGEVKAELLETQVNPAVWEISGHMVLKRREDFEEACEQNAWRLLAEVSLSEARFEEVKALIFEEAISPISSSCGAVEEEELETTTTTIDDVVGVEKGGGGAAAAAAAVVPGGSTLECLVHQ